MFAVGFIISYTLKGIYNQNNEVYYFELKDGLFIQVVYIGASNCYYCDDHTHDAFRIILEKLRNFAIIHESNIITTGVSADLIPKIGFEYLSDVHNFDEIIVGTGWHNLGITRYVWNDFSDRASTPQILILLRSVRVESALNEISNIKRDEKLIIRLRGAISIADFKDSLLLNNHLTYLDSIFTEYSFKDTP